MKLYVIPSGPIDTNAYLLVNAELGQAALIDAPEGIRAKVQPLLDEHRCELTQIWLTHAHWDHTLGLEELLSWQEQREGVPTPAAASERPRAKVWAHAADAPLHANPALMSAYALAALPSQPLRVDAYVEQGACAEIAGQPGEVRHVPGHCPGSILLHFPALQAAFVGDAIFQNSVGRTDLPGGDFEALARSIREQIYTLPSTTQLFPGHGPATDVATERVHNPYVHD